MLYRFKERPLSYEVAVFQLSDEAYPAIHPYLAKIVSLRSTRVNVANSMTEEIDKSTIIGGEWMYHISYWIPVPVRFLFNKTFHTN